MDPITIATGAISILQTVIPYINEAVKKGQVTPEEQASVLAKLDELRTKSAFTGRNGK